MAIRQYRPTSPGRRAGSVQILRGVLAPTTEVEKSLTRRLKRTGGRNHQGKITSRHRGGGARRIYRVIDQRRTDRESLKVLSVQYDPNRSARIALCEDSQAKRRYILAYEGCVVGDVVTNCAFDAAPKDGSAMSLAMIPLGSRIHNIEITPGAGATLCRSAGTEAWLDARESGWAQITLPSGEVRRVSDKCVATIGGVGNSEHQAVSVGKAGRNRWKGIRPYVRGVAMNPVAHPMGGGEGRTSGGRHPCSPQGKLAKGGKTRRRRNPTSHAIVKRRVSRRNGQLKT